MVLQFWCLEFEVILVILGQGYIWRVHKIPGSDKWELAMRSHQLWEEMAESITNQGMDPLLELGWKKTGPDIGLFLCLSINCLIKVLIDGFFCGKCILMR